MSETVDLNESIGKAIGDAVAEGMNRGVRRKKSFGEYQYEGGHSPFHPNTDQYPNGPSHPKLKHQCFQNGGFMWEDTLHDVEIELLNTLTHSGRYCDRLVEVIVNNEGQVDATIDIRFANKTVDDRFNVQAASQYSSRRHKSVFHAMLEQVANEQAQERAELAEHDKKSTRRMVAKLEPGNGVPENKPVRPKSYMERAQELLAEREAFNSGE